MSDKISFTTKELIEWEDSIKEQARTEFELEQELAAAEEKIKREAIDLYLQEEAAQKPKTATQAANEFLRAQYASTSEKGRQISDELHRRHLEKQQKK